MSEAEYVQAIRDAAQRWIAEIEERGEGRQSEALAAWVDMRDALSPWTAVALCEAWLAARNGQAKPVAGE